MVKLVSLFQRISSDDLKDDDVLDLKNKVRIAWL
jgi:hypothetical protein